MRCATKVELAHPCSTFVLTVEVDDRAIDMLGHVSNIQYLQWVQDAALAHSAAVGLDMEGYRKLGAVFVVTRHEVDYLRPVVRGDVLEVRTWIDRVSAAKCQRATEVIRLTPVAMDAVRLDAAKVVVARALTTWGYIELATGKPTRIPDSVRVAFSQPTLRNGVSAVTE